MSPPYAWADRPQGLGVSLATDLPVRYHSSPSRIHPGPPPKAGENGWGVRDGEGTDPSGVRLKQSWLMVKTNSQ